MNKRAENDYQSSEPLNTRSRMQEEYSLRQVNWYRWVGEILPVKPASRILDLGSGTGNFWQENTRLNLIREAVLLDTSPAMLAECRRKLHEQIGRFFFAAADVSSLPLRKYHFDFILALGILDYIQDVPAALRGIRNVMQPGARLYASTAAEDHLIELCQLVSRFTGVVRLGSTSEAFTMENGEQILKIAFKYVKAREFTDSLEFPHAASVMAYIRSETSVVAALKGDVEPLEAHIREMIDRGGPLVVRLHKVLFEAHN